MVVIVSWYVGTKALYLHVVVQFTALRWLRPYSGKRKASVWCRSVCLSVCPAAQHRHVGWSTAPSSEHLLNNSHDNVYGAVIMTKVIARVHPVHLMNADWAPGDRQPSDQASRFGLPVRRKLAAIIHIHHRHCYYYSARRLILILPSHEG